MSQGNIDVVLASIDAYNAQDFDAQMTTYAVDAVIVYDPAQALLLGDRLVGREVLRSEVEATQQFYGAGTSPQRCARWASLRSYAVGRSEESEPRAASRDTTQWVRSFTLRDGLITRLEFYRDHDEALKAAGLDERAMSANVQIVRSLYAKTQRGDFSFLHRERELRDFYAPDFEWHTRENLPDAGVRRGYEGLARLRAEWAEAFDDLRVDVDELIDAGDRVVAVARICGCLPGSGHHVEVEETQVWKMRDGRATEAART